MAANNTTATRRDQAHPDTAPGAQSSSSARCGGQVRAELEFCAPRDLSKEATTTARPPQVPRYKTSSASRQGTPNWEIKPATRGNPVGCVGSHPGPNQTSTEAAA